MSNKDKGFASMDKNKVKEIAAKGGRTSNKNTNNKGSDNNKTESDNKKPNNKNK